MPAIVRCLVYWRIIAVFLRITSVLSLGATCSFKVRKYELVVNFGCPCHFRLQYK